MGRRRTDLPRRRSSASPASAPAFLGEACGGDDALRQEVQSLLGYDAGRRRLPRAAGPGRRSTRTPQGAGAAARGAADRRVPDPLAARRGRDGPGLSREGPDARPRSRDQGALPLDCRRARGPPALRRGGSARERPQSSEHRHDLRRRGRRAISPTSRWSSSTGRRCASCSPAGRFPNRVILDLAAQLADALSVAHAHGIIHRDLKPENIMVTPEGRLKVLDFGIAKLQGPRDPAAAGSGVHTEDGKILGTVGYMSPEQAAGKRAVPASDQFSLGTILYEMVTGRRAWKRSTAAETLTAIIREDPPPIASAAPGTPIGSALDHRPLPRQGPGGALRLDPRPRPRPRDAPGPSRRAERREACRPEGAGDARPAAPPPPRPARRPRMRRGPRRGHSSLAADPKTALTRLDSDRVSSRHRLVRALYSRRSDDRLQRGMGR